MGRGNYSGDRRGATGGDPKNMIQDLLPTAEEKIKGMYGKDLAKAELRGALGDANGDLGRAAHQLGMSHQDFFGYVQQYKLTHLVTRENS